MKKMGYEEYDITMELSIGGAPPGVKHKPAVRVQTLKSSPFCPASSSKSTKSIVKDHMVSHYKKVYSAKAVIDVSVPKSLIHSIKYNDQIRQERLRRGSRIQSAHSLSQRNSRASCSSAQSRLSAQYDDRPYLGSRSSMVSSPRFNSSFHANDIVYPSHEVGPQNHSHHIRPASERNYRSPEAASHRKKSTCSLGALVDQSGYKTFQDPVQKTYSGDLLQKHSQHFTNDKPFTPKTLKSEKRSYLSQYRYYRAPRRKPTQDRTHSSLMQQETNHESTKNKECTQELYEPSQGTNTEHEWSEDEFNGTYLSASRQPSRANKSGDSLSRVSPEGGKSPIIRNVSSEEEELMYLQFISAVTEDILSSGHISDRFLDRVINRHIEMNRHQLDVGKMRHLLEVLRKDFEKPANTSTSTTELEKRESDLLDSFLPHFDSGKKKVKARKDDDLFPYASLIKYGDSLNYADPLMASTPLRSPETTAASQTKTHEKEGKDDNQEEKGISSPWLSEHVPDNTGMVEEDHQDGAAETEEVSTENQEYTTKTSEKDCLEDQAEDSYNEQSKELDDLGTHLSESLHVSNNVKTATEQHINTDASVSDDDF